MAKKRKPAGPALSDAEMLEAVAEGAALAEWGALRNITLAAQRQRAPWDAVVDAVVSRS